MRARSLGRTRGPISGRLARSDLRALRCSHRLASRLGLAIAALGTWVVWGPDSALAQRPEQPRITVAPTIVAEPASQALLPIEVGPAGSLPNNSFVRVRGLPLSVSLTDGHAIGPGSWAIPLFGLPMLRANVPAGVSGRTEIVLSLVSIDGVLLAETKTVLVVEPAATPPPPPRATAEPAQKSLGFVAAPPPTPAARTERRPQASPLLPEQKARAERLLARGEEYFVGGNIAAARDFFERAAEAGLAAAALRLAASYDPAELQGLQVQGVVPDRALARKWYERARELGAVEAVERLARLGGS